MELMKDQLLKQAQSTQEQIVKHRRYFHQNPEVHLNLPKTKEYVLKELRQMGYEPIECGTSGVIALAGEKHPGKCFLIRGDMDALPIREDTDLPFKSDNDYMHACGHDMHTAMMLGAAQLLKDNEDQIQGTVKLMFQPAEETLVGAKEMIENGLLENPKVDAGLMLHVASGLPIPAGKVIISSPGIGSAASDRFEIDIKGKGGHGAMPQDTVDPLNIAAHIHISLQAIMSREISGDGSVLTVGKMAGGETANVIPDTAMLEGTIRTFDPKVRGFVKKRLVEISEQTAKMFRAEAKVIFTRGCPSLINDKNLTKDAHVYMKELFGESDVINSENMPGGGRMTGSEDFSYVTVEVPATMMALTAGSIQDGYNYPIHHPKVRFDENVLWNGTAMYAYTALRWLEDNV